MKVYEFLKLKASKKLSVKTSKVLTIKKYYLSMYRAEMMHLYDKGYIADPTLFSEQELRMIVVDLNIPELYLTSGKMELSEELVRYALAKNKSKLNEVKTWDSENKNSAKVLSNLKEIINFLTILDKVLYYKRQSEAIDAFYEANDFKSDTKKKVSINVALSGSKVYNKKGYEYTESVMECFLSENQSLEYISLYDEVYNLALKELGICPKDYETESLFVRGLSREEEMANCKLIFNGLVTLDGIYADVLVEWLKSHKWSENNKFSIDKEGLFNVLSIYSSRMLEIQSEYLNKYLEEGSLYMMDSTGFYLLKERTSIKLPIGLFAVVSSERDDFLAERNRLEGYTGEVKPLSYLIENNYNFIGCPIELYVNNKEKELFVDIEQTEFADAKSYFKHQSAAFAFEEGNNISPVEGLPLADTLVNAYNNSEYGVLTVTIPMTTQKDLEAAKKEAVKKLGI